MRTSTTNKKPLKDNGATADLLKIYPHFSKQIEHLKMLKKDALIIHIINSLSTISTLKNELEKLTDEHRVLLKKTCYLMEENTKFYREDFAPLQIIVLHKN
jgi:hypothetical protein